MIKNTLIGDAADALLNAIQDRRSVRLELEIIALIAFAVIVGLDESCHESMNPLLPLRFGLIMPLSFPSRNTWVS